MRVDSTTRPACRAAGVLLVPTRKATLAAPWPWVRSGTIHDASELSVHVHSRDVSTLTVPAPPEEENECVDAAAETTHLSDVGAVVDVEEELQDQAPNRMGRK